MPASSVSGAYTFNLGTRSFSLGGDLADRVYRRVQQLEGSANYGGNVESAPPTADARLGHIVIGNTIINDETDHMDPDLLRFLFKQKQPVVQVDSTWLDVGHVDEMLTFVPNRSGSVMNFAALRASSKLAMDIVRAAATRYLVGLSPNDPQNIITWPSGAHLRLTTTGPSPVTRLLRGKLWLHLHPDPTSASAYPDMLEPPRIYQRLAQAMNGVNPTSSGVNVYGIHYWPGPGPKRVYPADITVLELMWAEQDGAGESTNDFIEEQFLSTIEGPLRDAMRDLTIYPLPVVFDRTRSVVQWRQNRWSNSTSAFTPDVVNMQVLNNHLLIPRPYGPRMKAADAQVVLDGVLQNLPDASGLRLQLTPRFLQQSSLLTTTCWVIRTRLFTAYRLRPTQSPPCSRV